MGMINKVLNFTREGIFAEYESTRRTRVRKLKESTGNADKTIIKAGPTLWRQARHLDENHDLVHGILNILVNNTVGTRGIQVEPQVRLNNGEIAADFVEELQALYREPILELVYRAAAVHRRHHNAREVQLCHLVSVKTGGCSEDCKYCAQSSRYPF